MLVCSEFGKKFRSVSESESVTYTFSGSESEFTRKFFGGKIGFRSQNFRLRRALETTLPRNREDEKEDFASKYCVEVSINQKSFHRKNIICVTKLTLIIRVFCWNGKCFFCTKIRFISMETFFTWNYSFFTSFNIK